VRGLLSSPRRRRRTLTFGSLLLLVGVITASMIHWSNTSHYRMLPVRQGKAQVSLPPKPGDYKQARKEGVLQVAAAFVNTAVRRKHVERSYDLATPALRNGYTPKTWATQDIPVTPYPLDFAKYQLKGSFSDSVWYQVAVFPDHAHSQVPAAVFDLVLRPSGNGSTRHWLVDSWAPAGYTSIPSGPLGQQNSKSASGQVVEYKGALSGYWLFVPVSAFGFAIVLLVGFGLRGWWRNSRAVKRYKSSYL
jgi:hypothetical protein